MQCIIFQRPDGAYGLGHSGFGFQDGAGGWIVGGVENSSNTPYSAPGSTDAWSERVGNPFAAMAAHHYSQAKIIDLPTGSPRAADAAVSKVRADAYWVIGRNCADATWDVLTAFGARLPLLQLTLAPNLWFATCPGRFTTLSRSADDTLTAAAEVEPSADGFDLAGVSVRATAPQRYEMHYLNGTYAYTEPFAVVRIPAAVVSQAGGQLDAAVGQVASGMREQGGEIGAAGALLVQLMFEVAKHLAADPDGGLTLMYAHHYCGVRSFGVDVTARPLPGIDPKVWTRYVDLMVAVGRSSVLGAAEETDDLAAAGCVTGADAGAEA